MIYFFMKKIASDISAEEIARIKSVLQENKIPFDINPVRSQSSIGIGLDARAYARSNIPLYQSSAAPNFVYYVYVKRKDYQKARKLLYGD